MILRQIIDGLLQQVDATIFVFLAMAIVITEVVIWVGSAIKIKKNLSLPTHLFVLSSVVIMTMFSTSIVSGKGYDCPHFVYIVNLLKTDGLWKIRWTNRPLTYLVMYGIGELFNVPGRIAVPISGIVFAGVYILSVFTLGRVIGNDSIGLGAALFAMSSTVTKHLTLNYIGNLFGLALMFFWFATIFWKTDRVKVRRGIIGVLFFAIYFSHQLTAVIALGIILVHLFVRNRHTILRKENLPYGVALMSTALVGLWIVGSQRENFLFLVLNPLRDLSMLKHLFLNYLTLAWTMDTIIIYSMALVGVAGIVASGISNFMSIWVISLLGMMLIYPTFCGRVLLYIPTSLLAVLGLQKVTQYLPSKRWRIFSYVLIFLCFSYSFFNYYEDNKITNLRYTERGPFVWDTVFVEEKQLIYIAENYDLEQIIFITDIEISAWERTFLAPVTHPWLRPGAHYRIIAELGSHIFIGKINTLLEEGYHKTATESTKVWAGWPEYGDQDIPLEGKTLLVVSTLYNLTPDELLMLDTTDFEGVYTVKDDVR